MSPTISSTNTFPSNATTANGAAANGSATGSKKSDPLASLTGNFQTFLQMLMTQLQNQDPTSPMDSNAFTTELVQFAGVEQQVNTNTNLNNLIQLTQGSSVLQSTQMIGKTVQATSAELSLQGGSAAVGFTAPTPGGVTVSVTDGQGHDVYDTQVSATAGKNAWSWNGQTNGGATAPDGAYNVTVTETSAGGSTTQLATTVTGTVTGVQSTATTVLIELGQLSVPVSAVTAVH